MTESNLCVSFLLELLIETWEKNEKTCDYLRRDRSRQKSLFVQEDKIYKLAESLLIFVITGVPRLTS